MQGGNNFEQSFVAGALGSLASSAFTIIVGSTGVGNILFSALSGGVGSKLTGGNFWEGAVIAGIVAGLNHAMYSISSSIEYKNKINQFLKDNGVDPSANPTQAILDKYKIIFKEYWNGSAQWAEFANDEAISEWERGDAAKLSVNSSGTLKVSSSGNAWGVTNSLGKVILAPGLLSRTNYRLASVFIHEMRHSMDYVSGYYNLIYRLPNVNHIMEYRAYYESYKWTGLIESQGSFHKSNMGYVPSLLLNH